MVNAENHRDFFKLHFFSRRERIRGEIFGIFSKLHFFSTRERIRGERAGNIGIFSKLHFFPGGKGSVENGQENPRDFFKVALFFPVGKDPLRSGGRVFPALCSRQISTYVEFVPGFFDIKN